MLRISQIINTHTILIVAVLMTVLATTFLDKEGADAFEEALALHFCRRRPDDIIAAIIKTLSLTIL